jgi:hypothetical protein
LRLSQVCSGGAGGAAGGGMAAIRFQGSGVRGAAWGAYGVRALAPAFRRRRQAAALQMGAPGAPLGACPDLSGSAGSSKRKSRRSPTASGRAPTAAPDGLYERRTGKSRLFTLPPLAPRGLWSFPARHSSLVTCLSCRSLPPTSYSLLPVAFSLVPSTQSLAPSSHGASQSRA